MSEISNTKWQMVYQDQAIVDLPQEDWLQINGDERAYKYKSFPPYSSPKWEDAPVDSGGKLTFKKNSRLPGGYAALPHKKIDFTYFRTIVVIPKSADIDSFLVTINHVDDGARMYLFNNNHKDGTPIQFKDAKRGGDNVVADFTDHIVEGQNTIVIVQFDQNPVLNTLTGGIKIEINGEQIKTDPSLPIPPDDGITRDFYWAEGLKKDGDNKATGTIHGIPFTYESDSNVNIQRGFHQDSGSLNIFKQNEGLKIPRDKNTIKNSAKSKNTLKFDRPIKDLIIVFGSIGNSTGTMVPVEFDKETEILWQENVTVSGRKITGYNNGYAIVKIPGEHSSFTFEYMVAESFVDFYFGCSV